MNTSKTPVHFEIPVDDMKRAQKFYKELFGWEIIGAGSDFEGYFTVKTVSENEKGINGGMMKRSNPDQQIINYISVDNIDKLLTKLEDLGGTILMPKMPVKGIGWNCVVQDSEGNTFGMLQQDSNAN